MTYYTDSEEDEDDHVLRHRRMTHRNEREEFENEKETSEQNILATNSNNGFYNVEVYEGGRKPWMPHKRGRTEDRYDLSSDVVVLADASRGTEVVNLPGLESHGAEDEGYDPEKPDIFPLQHQPAPGARPRVNPPNHFQPYIPPDQHPKPYRDANSSNFRQVPDRPPPPKTRRGMDSFNIVNTLAIKGIPPERNTEKDLREYFEKFGKVLYVRPRIGPNTDIAYVQFESRRQATEAKSCPDAIFNNRFIHTHWAKHDITDGPRFQAEKSNNRNLDPQNAEDPLPDYAASANANYFFRNRGDKDGFPVAGKINQAQDNSFAERNEAKAADGSNSGEKDDSNDEANKFKQQQAEAAKQAQLRKLQQLQRQQEAILTQQIKLMKSKIDMQKNKQQAAAGKATKEMAKSS